MPSLISHSGRGETLDPFGDNWYQIGIGGNMKHGSHCGKAYGEGFAHQGTLGFRVLCVGAKLDHELETIPLRKG